MDPVLHLQHRGVGIHLDTSDAGETVLKAYPADRITEQLRVFIREHRDEITALLVVPEVEYMVGNLLALPPEGREGFRREVDARGPADEFYDIDTDALRRMDALLEQRVKGQGA